MMTRREFQTAALASIPAVTLAATPKSRIHGVDIGVQTYSYRDLPLGEAIEAMRDLNINFAEIWSGHFEPKVEAGPAGRDHLRQWRRTVEGSYFRNIRSRFSQAKIKLVAINYSFRDDFTEEEIARGFDMAAALGVDRITASSNVACAKRVDEYARKAGMVVGMHNHSRVVPNEFARPEDFEKAIKETSNIAINLDIGHFWAAGYDPVEYIKREHERIICLHAKDKKRANDQNMPFGEGDTPIREVMQLLKTSKFKIPVMIEYEYKGKDAVTEVRKCYEYLKQCLA